MPTKVGAWIELKKVNDKAKAARTGMTMKKANKNQ
jgi:hypothetical protein